MKPVNAAAQTFGVLVTAAASAMNLLDDPPRLFGGLAFGGLSLMLAYQLVDEIRRRPR